MKSIVFTSVFLVVFTVLCQITTVNWAIINTLFIIGNLLVIYMVYNVLTDIYSTSKNFEDWYEDKPRQQ